MRAVLCEPLPTSQAAAVVDCGGEGGLLPGQLSALSDHDSDSDLWATGQVWGRVGGVTIRAPGPCPRRSCCSWEAAGVAVGGRLW